MTIEQIKSSPILEFYVLGLLSKEEKDELKHYLNTHPALQQELDEIQNALVQFAKDSIRSIEKPTKKRILNKVQKKISGHQQNGSR